MRQSLLFACLIATPSLLFCQGRLPSALPSRDPQVIEDSKHFHFRPIEDDQGGYFVVWTRQVETQWSLRGQHVGAADTVTWVPAGIDLAPNLDNPDSWHAVSDGKGGLALVWSHGGSLYAQSWASDGQTNWPTLLRLTGSTRGAASPRAVADATGGIYVVWSEPLDKRFVLMAQRVTPTGKVAWGPKGIRVALRPSDQRAPKLVFDGQSGFIAVWKDSRESASQIQAQRMDFQGNRLWGPMGLLVTAPDMNPKDAALLGPLGNGSAAVGWLGPDRGASRIYVQGINAKGTFRWGTQGMTVSLGVGDQWNPVLFSSGGTRLWAAWDDYRSHQRWQVYIGTLDVNQDRQAPPQDLALSPSASDQGHVAITDDGRGGVFSVWLDNRFGTVSLFAQETSTATARGLGDSGQLLASGLKDPAPPQIVTLGPGRFAAAWSDRKAKNQWALYWMSVDVPAPERR